MDVYEWFEVDGGRYDLIVAVEVLEHLAEPEQVVNAAVRLLKPGGVMVGTVPIAMPYEAHFQVYNTSDEVFAGLGPDVLTSNDEHWLMRWDG